MATHCVTPVAFLSKDVVSDKHLPREKGQGKSLRIIEFVVVHKSMHIENVQVLTLGIYM